MIWSSAAGVEETKKRGDGWYPGEEAGAKAETNSSYKQHSKAKQETEKESGL